MSAAHCYLCNGRSGDRDADGNEVELRPYGAGGQPICFACMTADPEREAEAERQFLARLEECGPVAALDGSCSGPRTATYGEAVLVSDVIDGEPLPGLGDLSPAALSGEPQP